MDEQERLLQQILQQLERAGGRPGPDMEDAKKSLQDYTKLLKSGNKLDKEEQALTAKGMKQEGQRQSLTTKAMRTTTKAIGGTLSVAQALEAASTAMRDNRESFRSLNPSIEMAGSAIKMAGKVTGGLVAATVGAIPLIGGLGQAAGTVIAALSEAAGEIVSAVGKTFTAELDRITGAFRTAAQTGALGADGMRGLGQQAVNAGLSFDSFAKTVTKEGETLSFAFGTSAEAAKGLSDTTKAMRPFRSELLTLGIGVEQQNELTAKYIQFQQRQGRNEVQNTQALAQGSREYMKNLQELSKITGKSIEESQKEIDAIQRDARQGASIREIERQNGAKAAQATLKTITTLNSIPGLKAIGDGLADALSNAGTPAAQEFLKVMGPVGQQVISQLKSGAIDTDQALKMIQDQGKNFYKGLGGDAFASQVGKMGTSLENVIPALQTLTFTKDLGAASKNASDEVNKLAKTNDSLTKNVVSAQEAMIKTATALDQFALDKTLPLASAAVKAFADVQLTTMKGLVNYLDIMIKDGIPGVMKKMKEDALKAAGTDEKEATGFLDTALKVLAGAGTGAAIGATTGAVLGAPGGPLAGLTAAVGGIGGAIAGGLGAYFGKDFLPSFLPGRAEGGAVESGKSYLVGEKGPELLKMGKTSGVVIPGQVGPGVPGRIPGTFDVKLGDGSVVTVDSRGNELYRKGPRIGGLQMSSSADASTSMSMQGTANGVNYERDYINGQLAGQKIQSGSVSSYTSKGGVSSVSYGMGDGVTVGAQGAATGGQFDALSQLRSVAGPKLGDAGGLSISNQGLTDMEGGPAAGQTQTIQGDGGSNEKILGVLQAMLDQTTKGTRLQGEQLQAARNN